MREFRCAINCARYQQAPDMPDARHPWAKPSGDHIPLGGFVHLNPATSHRDNGVDSLEAAVSSKRSQSRSQEETVGTATEEQLSLQYAELMRLRKAVQEAVAAQSENRRRKKVTAHSSGCHKGGRYV
jgi:hypothetical protein